MTEVEDRNENGTGEKESEWRQTNYNEFINNWERENYTEGRIESHPAM